MLKALRYALATVCFAASVWCLTLWIAWINSQLSFSSTRWHALLDTNCGTVCVSVGGGNPKGQCFDLRFAVYDSVEPDWIFAEIEKQGSFGRSGPTTFFPLWYASLIFALAGVAALRLGRRFTLRSAIIATTVVAGLLGMAVAL
jgi:hypothetical protein